MEENEGELKWKINLVGKECFCGICKDLLKMPVTMPCGHNFCWHCLSGTVAMKSECPICMAVISAGLFKVNRALWAAMKILFENQLPVADVVPADGVLVVANPPAAVADDIAAAGDDLAEAAVVDMALDDPPVHRALRYAMLGFVILGGLWARLDKKTTPSGGLDPGKIYGGCG